MQENGPIITIIGQVFQLHHWSASILPSSSFLVFPEYIGRRTLVPEEQKIIFAFDEKDGWIHWRVPDKINTLFIERISHWPYYTFNKSACCWLSKVQISYINPLSLLNIPEHRKRCIIRHFKGLFLYNTFLKHKRNALKKPTWNFKFQLNLSMHVYNCVFPVSPERGITPTKIDANWRHSNLICSTVKQSHM